MLVIFESILPIFLLVMAGVALRRLPLLEQSMWDGLERLSFYVLFPTYLFMTLAQADYGAIRVGLVSTVYLSAIAIIAIGLLSAWPALKRSGVSGSRFTSLFQTSTRWNGFVALAIAERVADKGGLAMVAFIIGAIIIPINVANIALLIWFGGGKRNLDTLALKLVTNPLIFASVLGIAYDWLGWGFYPPIGVTLDLIARCALGLGLLLVGAGLVIGDALRPSLLTWLPVALKLLVFPLLVIALSLFAGLDSTTIGLLALCASVPTAMNGYLLAKSMGGDAPFYAAVATLQTAASFVTIPLVLALARLF